MVPPKNTQEKWQKNYKYPARNKLPRDDKSERF